ncbi:MAG: hypothetical protein ACFFBD_17900 [Candidatus Hodarchaeota archaeon]
MRDNTLSSKIKPNSVDTFNSVKIITSKFTKGQYIAWACFSSILLSVTATCAMACVFTITSSWSPENNGEPFYSSFYVIPSLGFFCLSLLIGTIIFLALGMYTRRSKFAITLRQYVVLFILLVLTVANVYFLVNWALREGRELKSVFSIISLIVFFGSSIFFSFPGCTFLLSMTSKINYIINLQTKELVFETRFSILEGKVKRWIKDKVLKGRIITKKDKKNVIVLEMMSKKKVHIPGKFDPSINNYMLELGALYLIKYLKIPITLKAEIISKDKRGKTVTFEMLQHREEFTRDWRGSRHFEIGLQQLGWSKVSEAPIILRELGISGKKLLIFGILFVFLPGFLVIALPLNYPLSGSIGELVFAIPIFIAVFSFFTLFIVSTKQQAKIDEKGLQCGQNILGIPTWSIQWPYEFIQKVQIEKVDENYHVSIDFFLGKELLGEFKSKEEAEQFRAYISHLCDSYYQRKGF